MPSLTGRTSVGSRVKRGRERRYQFCDGGFHLGCAVAHGAGSSLISANLCPGVVPHRGPQPLAPIAQAGSAPGPGLGTISTLSSRTDVSTISDPWTEPSHRELCGGAHDTQELGSFFAPWPG
jgi:hypothetical protein